MYNKNRQKQEKIKRETKRGNKKSLINLTHARFDFKKKILNIFVDAGFKKNIYAIREWPERKRELLNHLIAWSKTKKDVYPSQRRLAAYLKCSTRQVRTYLTELENEGHIFYRQIGFESSCRYLVSQFYNFKGVRKALVHFLPALAAAWERNFLLLETKGTVFRKYIPKIKKKVHEFSSSSIAFLKSVARINNISEIVPRFPDEAFPSQGVYCEKEQDSSLLLGSFLTERSEGKKNTLSKQEQITNNVLEWLSTMPEFSVGK